MSEIVKLYNPANAASLTPEQIEGLQKLTNEEIKELALAYPNSSMTRHYLMIIEGGKPTHTQIPNLSSFENLYNLRTKNALKYIALSFRGNYKPGAVSPVKAKRSEVVDLSDTELMNLPGFKTAVNKLPEDIQVKVTKVKKEKAKSIKSK